MALSLFIGLTSDTLWALDKVLSLMRAAALMGIRLWSPPVCTVELVKGTQIILCEKTVSEGAANTKLCLCKFE